MKNYFCKAIKYTHVFVVEANRSNFDTGSAISILAHQFVKKLGLRLKRHVGIFFPQPTASQLVSRVN